MEKKIFIICLFTFLVISITHAQGINQQDFFQQKVERYHKMKKNGLTMGIAGASLSALGAIFVSQAEWEKETTETGVNYNTDDPSGITGIGCLVIGVPLTITGIILGSIGNKKEKEYRGKLDNFSVGIISTPQITGLKLTYNLD